MLKVQICSVQQDTAGYSNDPVIRMLQLLFFCIIITLTLSNIIVLLKQVSASLIDNFGLVSCKNII